jgi:hypothetical protein
LRARWIAYMGAVVLVAGCGSTLPSTPSPSPSPSLLPSLTAATPSLAAASSTPPSPSPSATPVLKHGEFTLTGPMVSRRAAFSATLLLDGRVLVTGGMPQAGTTDLATAEIYDPKTGKFSPTGSMAQPRSHQAAVRLRDGRVMVDQAEIYDPATGAFAGTPCSGRGAPATLLSDGRVLLLSVVPLADRKLTLTAQIFDPITGTCAPTGAPSQYRATPESALLSDGRVLFAGDCYNTTTTIQGCRSAEIYDPATGRFQATGDMVETRGGTTMTRLPDGRVLVAGGTKWSGGRYVPLQSAELFDPKMGRFTPTGSMLMSQTAVPFFDERPTATLLEDGRVLVAGGTKQLADSPNESPIDTAQTYDALTGRWTKMENLPVPLEGGQAVLLDDGRVLIMGGWPWTGLSAGVAMVFQP